MRPRVERWLVIGLLLAASAYALAEDMTLTTYYPSPRGVYNELRTLGDVGIGNIASAPQARLHVTRTDDAGPVLRVDDQAAPDASPFVVTQLGDVGIGTGSPTQKLTVVGTIQSTSGGFQFPDSTVQTTASPWAASGANIFNTNTGNVGIGTGGPGAKLEVQGGNIKTSGTVYSQNTNVIGNTHESSGSACPTKVVIFKSFDCSGLAFWMEVLGSDGIWRPSSYCALDDGCP